MREHLTQPTLGFHPHAVEGEHRKARWKCSGGRGRIENSPQPAQRPAPQEPLVQVARQHRGNRGRQVEVRKQVPDLMPAFGGAQSEVGGDHAQLRSVTIKQHVQGSARFAIRHAEVEAVNMERRRAREQCIAVFAPGVHQRRSRDGLEMGLRCQVCQRVESAVARLHFLQRDYVGVDLRQHTPDARRIEKPVTAHGAMNVISGEAKWLHGLHMVLES